MRRAAGRAGCWPATRRPCTRSWWRPSEQTARYAALGEPALRLHTARRQHLSDARLAYLSATFEARIPAEWREQVPGCGGILAAAVADQRDGVPKALDSVAAWMTDPARFPSAWLAAAEWVIHEAGA
ncbi:MAG: hypothetical protein OHK0022_10780 [Roseiflexaceae bacterium]